jgi:hypothetical protein
MNEAALRELIRRRLAEGQLPSHHIIRFQARYGDDAPCAVCEAPMRPSDIAYEICYGQENVASKLALHYLCFCVWERERRTPNAA